MSAKLSLPLFVFFLIFSLVPPAHAAPGTPKSLEFALGVRLDPQDGSYPQTLLAASRGGYTWVALRLDWSASQPRAGELPANPALQKAISMTETLGLHLLLTITNPPAWALTSEGTQPAAAADLVISLKRNYPAILAFEILPGANTQKDWKAAPNPRQYARVFLQVQQALIQQGLDVFLLAGGLTNQFDPQTDYPDTLFLQDLYQAGLRPAMLSLQLYGVEGEPSDQPSQASLRHYEQIRAVMKQNAHEQGLLWITDLQQAQAPQNACAWKDAAERQLKAQLYLGAVFFQSCYLQTQLERTGLPQNAAEWEFYLLWWFQ
jgi:hypothetical protein